MPSDVTMPDGTVITDVPDGTTKAQLQAKYGAHLAQTEPNTAVDVARSIPGGIAKGVASIAGIPGDVASFERDPANYETATPWLHDAAKVINPAHWLPTSSTIANAVAAPFGGFYKPKTTAGNYAETIASFAPSALAPGSLLQRGARVVVPAVASETAGQLPGVKGTWAEPYARTVAALASGAGVGLGEGIAAERTQSASTPSKSQLQTTSGNLYRDMESKGLTISGGSFDNAIDDIARDLEPRGLNPRIPAAAQARLYPKASAALETLQAAKGQNIGLADLDKLRQTARVALESNDKADRQVAHAIIDGLDNFVNNLKPGDIASGDPAAVASINEARALWAKGAKADVIDRVIQKAERSSGQFPGAGKENAYRVQFRNLAKNERAMRQFSPEEQSAIERVERGGPVENALRFFGKFSPHGGIMTAITGGAGYAAGGGGVTGALSAAGALAGGELMRQGAKAGTIRNARLASERVRGGTATPQLAAPALREGTRALILANPARLNDSYAARVNALAAGP